MNGQMMNSAEYTQFLHQHIPLLAAAQARVTHLAPRCVELSAPLAANINPHGTAFGGSLSMLGVLAGWAAVDRLLAAESLLADLVIQRGAMEYLAPVQGDLAVRAALDPDAAAAFIVALRDKGRARIEVLSELRAVSADCVGARHTGLFAARLKPEARAHGIQHD